MIVEKLIYDVQTKKEEIIKVEETIEKPETPQGQSVEEKVQELLKQNDMLTKCVLEISELVYK